MNKRNAIYIALLCALTGAALYLLAFSVSFTEVAPVVSQPAPSKSDGAFIKRNRHQDAKELNV